MNNNSRQLLPAELYTRLPHLLKEPISKMQDAEDKELLLLGALGVLSGMLPKVQGEYFGQHVAPNLYCFVVGRYGIGKGGLLWARKLGDAVHQQRNEKTTELYEDYGRLMGHYRKELKQYEKGHLAEEPKLPPAPPHLKLYIPANTTKTAVMQLLMENEGRGIIFETEGDTLADMLRQDYGNFSDVLRKAYHHEPVSYYRRANNEDVEIPHPELSVVLSGTYDQLLKLIPAIDNGLFSRFCFYVMEGSDEFKDPFDRSRMGHHDYFRYLSEQLANLYQRLSEREVPLQFQLSSTQQQELYLHFSNTKEDVKYDVGDDLAGSVNRLGLMCYRIAMILSILRAFECRQLDQPVIICRADDYALAQQLATYLLEHTLKVYEKVKAHSMGTQRQQRKSVFTDDQILLGIRLYEEGKSLREISILMFGDESKYSTINRMLKKNGVKMR
ncbi:MAG: DUF3987 domain-containing protein [Flavipsychrobacter sp.]